MRRLSIILVMVGALYLSGARAEESSCINCHLSSDWVSDTTIAADFMSRDVHRNMGLGCEDCHGGDPKIGFEDPAKGFKDPPGRIGTPAFCGSCHSDVEYMKRYNPRATPPIRNTT